MLSFYVIDQQSTVTVVGVTFRTHERTFRGMHPNVTLAQRTFREGHRTVGALEFSLLLVSLHMPVQTVTERNESVINHLHVSYCIKLLFINCGFECLQQFKLYRILNHQNTTISSCGTQIGIGVARIFFSVGSIYGIQRFLVETRF